MADLLHGAACIRAGDGIALTEIGTAIRTLLPAPKGMSAAGVRGSECREASAVAVGPMTRSSKSCSNQTSSRCASRLYPSCGFASH